jgi:hypothetical protein
MSWTDFTVGNMPDADRYARDLMDRELVLISDFSLRAG